MDKNVKRKLKNKIAGKTGKARPEKKDDDLGLTAPPPQTPAKDPVIENNDFETQETVKPQSKKSKADQSAKTYIFDRFYEKLGLVKKLNARRVLSIDIDPDKIRYVVGSRSGKNLEVKSWGVQKFPADEKDSRKALQIALENIRSKVYSRGVEVSIGIFSPEINIRQVSLPKMKKESDLRQALDFKNQTDLQNYDENSVWSFEILDEFDKDGTAYCTVLVTSAPAEVVNYYMQIFDNLKIELKHIFPRPAAIQSAYQKMVFRPGRDLLINVAYDLTQMCYLKNGTLNFIRNVSIGSRNLEVTIHTPEDSGVISNTEKKKNDKQLSDENPALLRGRLLNKIKDLKNKQNPVLHTFFSEILRSMAFIQGRDVKQYIERIFITGYGIRKESLMPYLRSRLNIPVFILTPQFEDTPKRTVEFGEYFTTVGNSLQTNKAFNILPESYKLRKVFKKLNYVLVLLILGLVISLGYISIQQNRIIEQKKSLISQYDDEYKILNPFEGMYKDIKAQIQEVNQKNSELHEYVKGRPPIIMVLQFFSNETPAQIRLESFKFKKILSEEAIKQSDKKVFKNAYNYQIELHGVIRTDPLMGDVTLINYINHLIDLKFFKRVELLNKLKDPEKNTTTFDVRMFI